MSSLRKVLSARTNEGKSASSNAVRHGLLAETVLLSNECREKFQALLDAYYQKFQPRD